MKLFPTRWIRKHRRSCLRVEFLCMCVCLAFFYYLGYTASLQRDVRDVQLMDASGPIQDLCETSEKWILVNVSADDESDLSSVADIRGWRLLILRQNLQSPLVIRRCSNCIFIANPHDLNTGWPTGHDHDPAFLPFIFMIKRGAKWIYVTDDIDQLHHQIKHFRLGKSSGLVADTKVFSPSMHFVSTEYELTAAKYRVTDWPLPSIQTRWLPASRFTTSLHACLALPVLLPPVVTGVTDVTMPSLYGYEAFWTLVSLASSGSKLVWSLWKQRLLWEIRGSTAIFQPGHCDHLTPRHSESESQINKASVKNLLRFLQVWKCSDGFSFFNCVQLLTREMRKLDYFTPGDVHNINVWMEYLIEFEYKEPTMKRAPVNSTGLPVVYNAASSLREHTLVLESPFASLCKKYTKSALKFTLKTNLFQDVALIVMFNHWIPYDIIKYLNYLYSRYFSNIIYCGEKLPNVLTAYKTYKKAINFIQIETQHGLFAYKCAVAVMRLGLSVRGYLQMSDDVLVNFKRLAKLPKDKPWFQNVIRTGSISTNIVPNVTPLDPLKRTFWWPWNGTNGAVRLRTVWQKLKTKSNDKNVLEFLQTMKRNAGHAERAFYETSNIFYIPHTLKDKFVHFAHVFAKEIVHVDIAIPTILNGISHKEDIVHMNGTYLWFKQIPEYKKYYRTNNHFLYPFTMPRHKDKTKDLQFLCDVYLPRNL